MKKLVSTFLILILVFSITACGSAKPEDTVKQFCEAVKSTDWDKMASLCAGNRFGNSAFNEFEESAPFLASYVKENAPKLEYTVNATSVEDDTATVVVHIKYINGYLIVREASQETMKKMLGMALTGSINEDESGEVFKRYMSSAMADAQEKYGDATKETDIQFTLNNVDGKWVISDFDDELTTVLLCNTASALDDITGRSDSQSESNEKLLLSNNEGNSYSVIQDGREADKTLEWDKASDCWYDAEADFYVWYNTDVTPNVWQYWAEGISSDFGNYGWMEHDKDGWWIEADQGNWIALPDKYDTSHLWYIEG